MARRNDDIETTQPAIGGLSHLITEQDVHAFIDGQLPRDRRAAVERYLARNGLSARAAAANLGATYALRAAKDEIYRDVGLRSEIERLLAKRDAAGDAAPAAASAR